ncbi:MAG: marine proteobacterial sortase target protein [Granulosicoccus sp.]
MHHTHTDICVQYSTHTPRYISALTMLFVIAAISLFHEVWANERNPSNSELVQSSTLMLSNETGTVEAVQLDANMDISVSGLLAQMTLTQTFLNASDQWMQARYLFPLPDTAAVQALTVTSGDTIIHGRIMKREEARQTFEAASDAGQITGLVEQQRPNLFTMDVATVAPGTQLSVTLTAMLPVSASPTSRSLTLPTTHTPRYINETTAQGQAVIGAFTDVSQQRGPRLNLNLVINGMQDYTQVSSDSHALAIEDTGITLKNVPMNKDLVISWPVANSDNANGEVYASKHKQERFAQILLSPPAENRQETTTRRELVIVVDKSGSMAGESILAARKALQFALDNLNPDDHFNIIAFDDRSYPLFSDSRTATANNLKLAQKFVKALDADGGTEMRESLALALATGENNEDNRLRQVVFLTDGSVGYEDQLLLDIKQQLGDSRLFTIGIGSAPNQWFLRKAAEVGRGTALSIPDSYSAANAIEQLISRLANPVITDVSVQFIGGRGELYPNPIPDLYADKPQILASRLSKDVTHIIISGSRWNNGETERWQQRLDVKSNEASTDEVPPVKLFWTRLKVASLLDEQRYAKDPELNKSTITQLALNAQLLTPYTSFVAVDENIVRPDNAVQHSTEVASLIPHGNQMMNLAMPRGAAGVDTLGWLSAILAMVGLTLVRLSGIQLKTHNTLKVHMP